MDKQDRTAGELLVRRRREPVSIAPEATVLAALQLLADHDIGALLVMRGGSLVGLITERDCVRKVELQGRTAATTTVRDIMTDKVVYATPDDTVSRCMALMKGKHIRHLAVMEQARVVGVLSIRDILGEAIAEEEELIRALQQERIYFTETGGSY